MASVYNGNFAILHNGATGGTLSRIDSAFEINATTNEASFGFNVGIGTTNPANKLHIYDSTTEAVIHIQSIDDNATLILDADSGATATGYDTDPRLQFNSGGSTHAFIY